MPSMRWWRARVTEWLMNTVRHLGGQRARCLEKKRNCEDVSVNIGLCYIACFLWTCVSDGPLCLYWTKWLYGKMVNSSLQTVILSFSLIIHLLQIMKDLLYYYSYNSTFVLSKPPFRQMCYLCFFPCLSSQQCLTIKYMYVTTDISLFVELKALHEWLMFTNYNHFLHKELRQ